jgi:hypothetical protein
MRACAVLVSIVNANHNYERYLREAILSVVGLSAIGKRLIPIGVRRRCIPTSAVAGAIAFAARLRRAARRWL